MVCGARRRSDLGPFFVEPTIIRMPGQTGLEAAQAIVEDWPAERSLPLIVFVTAYDQYALQAFEHAAVDYVLKPVQRERLTVLLEDMLDSEIEVAEELRTAVRALSPFVGGALYFAFGINRVRRRALRLRNEALAAQRWNRLHPTEQPRTSYL